MPKLLLIDFACNDPDNGNFTGRCDKVELPESSFSVECTMLYGGVKISFDGETLSFGRLKIPHHGHKTWVGNWCWDGCWLAIPDTLKLLNYIKTLKHWSFDEGWCSLCDPLEAGTLTEEIIEHELFPPAKKEATHA